jgi:hypothetical protein
MRAHTHTHTHTHTLTHTDTHTHARARTNTHTRARTHTHTQRTSRTSRTSRTHSIIPLQIQQSQWASPKVLENTVQIWVQTIVQGHFLCEHWTEMNWRSETKTLPDIIVNFSHDKKRRTTASKQNLMNDSTRALGDFWRPGGINFRAHTTSAYHIRALSDVHLRAWQNRHCACAGDCVV